MWLLRTTCGLLTGHHWRVTNVLHHGVEVHRVICEICGKERHT